MAKTNAQRQADYRTRRNSWPKTDADMRALLLEMFWLGQDRPQMGAQKAHDTLDDMIEECARRRAEREA